MVARRERPRGGGGRARRGAGVRDSTPRLTATASAAINLLDLHVVKGLEFDAVVVVEPTAILAERPDGGRARYTRR